MFEKVVKELHYENRTALTRLVNKEGKYDENLAPYFSSKADDLREAREIAPGLYVESNTSAAKKIDILYKIFKLYEADPSDLVFYLKDREQQPLKSPAEEENV